MTQPIYYVYKALDQPVFVINLLTGLFHDILEPWLFYDSDSPVGVWQRIPTESCRWVSPTKVYSRRDINWLDTDKKAWVFREETGYFPIDPLSIPEVLWQKVYTNYMLTEL